MTRVSVVIPVRNDPGGLAATLDALASALVEQDAEVIVVDDASTDRTVDATSGRERVRVIRQLQAGGSYAARNAGIRASQGRFIALTDAGCVPAAAWLANGTRALEADTMTVVAGRVAMPLGPNPTIAAMVDVVNHLDQLRYVEHDGTAVTANILTTREVLDCAGLFDASLQSGGDREWVSRARSAGANLRYEHDAVVAHPPRTRARQLVRKSTRVARGTSDLRASGRSMDHRGRRPYLTLAMFRPWNQARGRVRLAENGARPDLVRWFAVGVGQVAWVQLPQAAAAAWADALVAVARHRARRAGRGG